VSQADRTAEQPAIFDEVDDSDTDVVDVPGGAPRRPAPPSEAPVSSHVLVVPRSPMPKQIPPPPRVPSFTSYEESLADLGPPSVAPVAVDTAPHAPPAPSYVPPPESATYTRAPSVTTAPPFLLRRKVIVGGALGGAVFLLAAAGLRALVATEDPRATGASPTTAGATIKLAPDAPGPLVVDGVAAPAEGVEVSCGVHVVRIGGAAPRSMDVPCDAVLVLSQPKNTSQLKH
jgi:hypothetical protein